jgi:hypothetical protein
MLIKGIYTRCKSSAKQRERMKKSNEFQIYLWEAEAKLYIIKAKGSLKLKGKYVNRYVLIKLLRNRCMCVYLQSSVS